MTQLKKSLTVILGVVVLLSLINPVYALTGSIGNARMILYPEVNGWFTTTIEKTILVRNVNDENVNITLQTDEEGEKFLEIVDKEFTLAPGEEKKAQFKVKVKKEGNYEGRINVFFSPISGKGAGVALSSTITVIAKKDQGYQENPEESEEDIQEEDTGDITGEVTNENDGSSGIKGILILSLSSLFLLGVLIFLMFFVKKKKVKKGGKLNDRKKK